MNCLINCIKSLTESNTQIRKPVDGYNLSPWVKMRFGKKNSRGLDSSSSDLIDNPAVTVGNYSSANNNHAVIKSMQFGMSNGFGIELEILDEEGGAMHLFFDRLNKNMKQMANEYLMQVQFGWVATNCFGKVTGAENPVMRSPIITCLPTHLQANFSDGKVKITITGVDLMQGVFASRVSDSFPNDGTKISLKQAIVELFKLEPKINVEFKRVSSDGTESPWYFEEEFRNVYKSDNQNRLAIALKWMEPHLTKNGKGIVPTWDTRAEEPTIVFWEDFAPGCNDSPNNIRTLGTWIVNGGQCSNVISFNSTFNWVASMAQFSSGGNAGGAESGKTEKIKEKCKSQGDDTGIQRSIPIPENLRETVHPDEITKKMKEGQDGHSKANRTNLMYPQAVSAEIVVQGDPSRELCQIPGWLGKFASIVVINPYHLYESIDSCGQWLARPTCNEILTSKYWLVQGVTHNIKEGSYQTVIKVFLPAPGINSASGSGLGGEGGYTPINT